MAHIENSLEQYLETYSLDLPDPVKKQVSDNVRDIQEQQRREPTPPEINQLITQVLLFRLRIQILEAAALLNYDISDSEVILLSELWLYS
jgi:hypothetical protein